MATDSDFTSKMKNRQMGTPGGMNMTKSTSMGGDMCNMEKTDGSQSDTAVSLVGTDDKKRRSSIGAKVSAIVGMSRKSRSTSQLSQTGRTGMWYRSLFLFTTLHYTSPTYWTSSLGVSLYLHFPLFYLFLWPGQMA